MDSKMLLGREKEKALIEKYYHSPKSEMVAVYGRRRVGKTFLVKECMGRFFDFEFIGMYKTSARIQRTMFQKAINALSNISDKEPKDWYEAFDNLKRYLLSLHKKKVVVFLDELPWMDTVNSNFLSAFSYFWNSWDSHKAILKLYVCGSATTWMVDKLIGDKGGLYGRVSRPIYLPPFSLYETELYLNRLKKMNYNKMQVLDAYMIFGGIPFYLDMLDSEIPFSANVDILFFATKGPLRNEYDFLFRSLFKISTNYQKVVEFLAKKLSGVNRDEISDACNLEGGDLTTILKNLNSCDFIRMYTNPKTQEKGKIYQLTDMFTLFFLRFVKGSDGKDNHYWTNTIKTGKKNAWSGYAFEQVCLHHIDQIKNKLGITGILSNVFAWSEKAYIDSDGNKWKGGQIDLIIDRSDNVMNLCEMKYSQEEYIISGEYAGIVRDRISLFKKTVNNKKALRCTFVTTFGVKDNKYSGIVDNQIRLEDFFG